ncbi:MAG: SUMF1/EgtB/PvdO family nonheme iron enzyme [Okeania sp. SIO2G4]|uniref:bifunctional serine/threonine-protein kinase/formylglycine-generating enzyme family protein n=1 Tax=unclassified Okeania TaxID=2634635 RepID=UPI0013BC12E8|nr:MULTISPECIES: bifunctional serine/threonine-protein kinase/formylglycine-generating enzyme family protein [unclassified Okeania]NEP41564.1 SUMF1/EgtB/PvdO family nonheme iron enzyme [Okeania sp. SIO2H7]NEP75965.1 SUMF1/EgtB/PvdO family nonheme iron enzyme [Okeania sp. SIO2G5]NEP95671.1 SUMF1/EgtB/PvdO family nonheme iron enzyme [Okeania sp. SIO2F5]NEQ93383.1 SUMF1/EgtB/PvdO family nonheme iron enzyme [Okeania sp. SIO2G4]
MQSGKILRQRYKIIQSLGRGGFGDTYLAEDLDLPGKPKCVVKHLSPKSSDPGTLTIAQRLFETEAETLYKLGKDSDQIPKLFAHFQEATEFYLVQEYIEGQDISKELTSGKKLSESYTITLLKGILEALEKAHQNNIIHRDIKPQNLMRRRSDKKIVLIDFGAVKEITVLTTNQPGTTILTVAVGTPGYMPSEQSNGRPKLSSDIYAVGMVGIKALTGKDPQNLPTDPKTGNVIWRNQAKVSNYLANILDRMVQEYFPQRYENATEVLEALSELVLAKTTVKVNPPTPTQTSTAKVNLLTPTLAPKQATTVPSPPQTQPNKTRRKILILGGLAGSGFAAAMLSKDWWNQPSPEIIPTPEPKPAPQPKTSIQKFTTVTVNSRGEIISRRQHQVEVIIENLGNGVTLEMVKIPAGSFIMGSPDKEAGRYDNEGPQHNVDVPEFFMGKYPVTQVQWQAVMGNNFSRFKGANRPVERVNWYKATEFCEIFSQITGKNYRLPSESQWEYACRAGTTTPFYFGKTITTELANYNARETYASAPKGIYRNKTTNVGIFPPNTFGLYDMHGNVWEWCADEWHDNYSGAPTDGSAWLDGNENRSPLRGGSWSNYPFLCRSAIRLYYNRRVDHDYDFGFRIVCDDGRTL